MAAPAAEPAAAGPAAARAGARAAGRAAVPRAAGGAGPGRDPRDGHLGQHGRHRRDAEPPGRRARCGDGRPQGPAHGRQGQRDRGGPDGADRGQRDHRPGSGAPGHRRPPARPDTGRPGRCAGAGLEAGHPLRRRPDPGGHGRGAVDATGRQGLGADQGAARRPRPQESGDRGARRAHRPVRGDALDLHQHRQRRSRAGGPADRAVGRWPAARGTRPDPRAAGPHRRRHRRRPERCRGGRGPPGRA